MNKNVELGLVVETESVPPVRAVATTPLTIALFGASKWRDSLKDKVQQLERDGHVKTFAFARKSIRPTVRPDGRPVLWDLRSV